MSLLFAIPQEISINVLSRWCELNDLGRLDAAVCSVKRRNNLQKILSSPGFDLHDNVTLNRMQFCADKGIAMKSVVLFHSDFIANRHRNIVIDRLNTQNITELQILKVNSYEPSNESMILCSQLAIRCNALENLILIGCISDVDMIITSLSISILHNLKVFYSDQSIIGFASYKFMAKHCKLLESLIVVQQFADNTELGIQPLLINNGSSLKVIHLFYHIESYLTNKTLQCVIDHCPRIQKLTLSYYYQASVSLSLVNQLLTKCTALTDFRLGNEDSKISLSHRNNKISIKMKDPLIANEHELVDFFSYVKQCNVIQIMTVPLLSATTLNTIVLHNSSTLLDELLVVDCQLVTTADVLKLMHSLPELTELTVLDCPLVDPQELAKYLD